MLPRLLPADRALVWGLLGGVPLYLTWWDQERNVQGNLAELACSPGGRLLTEGELVLGTEADLTDTARMVLYAIAGGKTKHNEIRDAVGTDPTRVLDRLLHLRLIDRLVPVTEDEHRTRRRVYRIADNFLAFWLATLDRYRGQIDRGMGTLILPVLMRELDDRLGSPWEEAFRSHLRRMAVQGKLGDGIVAIGSYWSSTIPPQEIDAVALAGRERAAVLAGEAKWTKRVNGARLRWELEQRATLLPRVGPRMRYAVCGREEVDSAADLIAITAADIFA